MQHSAHCLHHYQPHQLHVVLVALFALEFVEVIALEFASAAALASAVVEPMVLWGSMATLGANWDDGAKSAIAEFAWLDAGFASLRREAFFPAFNISTVHITRAFSS